MEYLDLFLNSDIFPVVLRILEFIFMTVLFVKGEISVSKYAQSFTNLERRFILTENGSVIPDKEDTDLQEEMNSHKDECLSSFLDKYLDFSNDTLPFAQDQLADGEYDILNELVGTKADKVLKAYDSLMNIRERYNVPERFSNEELITYLREASSVVNREEKGGVDSDEKKETEQKSE